MNFLPRLAAGLAALLLFAAPSLAAEQTIIVLDASGSMWTQIDGTARIDVARQALADVLKGVPDTLELGFMAYGHRTKASCDDIELLVPPAAGTAAEIGAAAARLNPKGKTPLSAAVRQAAELLKYTEDKASVILITDGIETCDADPCALGTELEKNGVDLTVDVVGFGLSDSEGKQVACLAENTGGKYFKASDAKALSAALVETVAEVAKPMAAREAPAAETPAEPGVSFAPEMSLSEGGPAIKEDGPRWDVFGIKADGTQGDSIDVSYGTPRNFTLPPGEYFVQASWNEAKSAPQKVTIVAGQVAKPVFNINAGTLILHPRPAEGLDVSSAAAVEVSYPDGSTTGYGDFTIRVPAGAESVKVSLDAGTITTAIPLAAGQTFEKDIIIGVGHLTANAFYSEGGDSVTDGGLTFNVVSAKKKIDGSRADFGTSYGPDTKRWLPGGDYLMEVTMDQTHIEVPFTVTVGEETTIDPVLNAGIAAIAAPGAEKIEVFGTKKNIKGERPAFGRGYDANLQTTLPAGDYVAVATTGDKTAEAPLSVKAGERTEITVAAP